MTPYQAFVDAHLELLAKGRSLPLGGFPHPSRPSAASDAPKALIFSPHPDDEVIIGGLPLRLARECGWRVINVAVTQGSNPDRQAERWKELAACCEHIGFDLLPTAPGGLTGINVKSRSTDAAGWKSKVEVIRSLIESERPRCLFFPHDDDWNSTHIGTHHLIVDALRAMDRSWEGLVVETEFWGAMDTPNLMVESSGRDLADLLAALTFHVGEVRRNPYHLRMPGWMMDNVRRGSELVGGQGGAAPEFAFATLYRLRRWREGGFEPLHEGGRFVGAGESLGELFGLGNS